MNKTIARGRVLSHIARYSVEKVSPGSGGTNLQVRGVRYIGEVEDLYDFNQEAGEIAEQPAILQVGHGNGSHGAARLHGQIYRSRFEFNVYIADPF